MIRQVFSGGRAQALTSFFRQMHISSTEAGGGVYSIPATINLRQEYPLITKLKLGKDLVDKPLKSEDARPIPVLTQARQGIIDIPLNSRIQPSIGIPPEMLRRSEYQTPVNRKNITPLEIPTNQGNINKEIKDSPGNPSRIEKQAARLIVIRRRKMNTHKLRKLRKKMKYVWAKTRLRRAIKKEKAYLNEKMALINAARQFDAKEYVAGIIQRAKEEPIPYRWSDPLMPEWFKTQEMEKEKRQARFQKMINLYLNKGITIDYTDYTMKKFRRKID